MFKRLAALLPHVWKLLALVVALFIIILVLAPHLAGVLVHKLLMPAAAAALAYWLDGQFFPRSRPEDLIENFHGDGAFTLAEAIVLGVATARLVALVVGAMLAVSWGA